MAENESRNERKKAEELRAANKSSLNKAYYWIIGILFLILLLLVIYIFASSGDKVNLSDDESTSATTEEVATEGGEAPSTVPSEVGEEIEEPEAAEEVEESEETDTDATSVNEDAPLDTDHAVDYNSGSADRIAIKEKVMQATGLGNDLIENWIGNNGPGRVTADVYSPDKSEVYRVYLQYGDGDWHVTSYESLNSIPEN